MLPDKTPSHHFRVNFGNFQALGVFGLRSFMDNSSLFAQPLPKNPIQQSSQSCTRNRQALFQHWRKPLDVLGR